MPLTISGSWDLDVDDTGAKLLIADVTVQGKVWDVYDFDFSDTTDYGIAGAFVKQAAELQAGYGTLGTGGHVFETLVELNTAKSNLYEWHTT